MYSKRGTESALDLNYEFHQRQSAVSFRVLASYPPPIPHFQTLFSPLRQPSSLFAVLVSPILRPSRVSSSVPVRFTFASFPRIVASLDTPSSPKRCVPLYRHAGDEKFWRRHKNAALHFPFKITPFAPFSVYYYQVVQSAPVPPRPPSATLCPGQAFLTRSRYREPPLSRRPVPTFFHLAYSPDDSIFDYKAANPPPLARFPRVSSSTGSCNSIRNSAFGNFPL